MIYMSPHIRDFSDVYDVHFSRVLQWARDLISSPKPTPVEAVEGVTLSCGPVTGHTRLLTYGKGRREHTHIAPWDTSSFPGLGCITNHLIGGAEEELMAAITYNKWQLHQ